MFKTLDIDPFFKRIVQDHTFENTTFSCAQRKLVNLLNSVDYFRRHMHRWNVLSYSPPRLMIQPCFVHFFRYWLRYNFFRLIMIQTSWYKTHDVLVVCVRFSIVLRGVVNHSGDIFFLHHLRVEKYLTNVTLSRWFTCAVLIRINLRRAHCVQTNSIWI